ncbi:MAG: GntR family transcriptional regulator [Cyclobacteriaceae bacterium]
MISLGIHLDLKVVRLTSPGAFLTDDQGNEVLLPNKFIPADLKVDDLINVFTYTDSEDRPIATTQKPFIELNQFGYLRVRDVAKFGAFMDWGLDKDLLVPLKQQLNRMDIGRYYLVYMYLDELTNRLVASAKVNNFYKDQIDLEEGQVVDVLIADKHELGLSVVINNAYRGLIYDNDIFHDVISGERRKAFVKHIRSDGKIDVTLRKSGLGGLEEGAVKILSELELCDGFISLNDKSSPDDIQATFQMSKKNFKRACGILYKQRKIKIEEKGIKLI